MIPSTKKLTMFIFLLQFTGILPFYVTVTLKYTFASLSRKRGHFLKRKEMAGKKKKVKKYEVIPDNHVHFSFRVKGTNVYQIIVLLVHVCFPKEERVHFLDRKEMIGKKWGKIQSNLKHRWRLI